MKIVNNRRGYYYLWAFILFFVLFQNIFASDFIGQNSSEMVTKRSPPLGKLFRNQSDYIGHHDDRQRMGLYRGFYQEGENLLNLCSMQKEIMFEPDFFRRWDQQQLKRIIAATLQKIVLDLTINSLPAYANFFEFTDQQFENLLAHLVDNSCSSNVTVMAKKTIRDRLTSNFKNRKPFNFPTLSTDSLFSKDINQINTLEGKREGEFLYASQLFKSVCSWDNDAHNMRLMVPLLRNPVVMAYVLRQMTSRQILWESSSNSVYLAESENTVKINCKNMICRQTDEEKELEKIPLIIGTDSYIDSYRAVYCYDFHDIEYPKHDPIPQIRQQIKSRTFDQENLIIATFISLITTVPDLFLWSKSYSQGSKYLVSNVDRVWNNWAKKQSDRFARELHYEEFLTLKKVDRSLYYNNLTPKFGVVFDINLGDLDRVTQMAGKIDVSFHLDVSKKYLKWLRHQWTTLDPRNYDHKEMLLQSLRERVREGIAKAQKKFIIPPWKTGLDRLIVDELLQQLIRFQGNYFESRQEELVDISITLSYAPFALKYLRFLFLSKKVSNNWRH
jgi:hypothetical protein